MLFPPNTNLTITDVTRGFKVLDTVIDSWVAEGIIPEPVWVKGRRRWDSNQINQSTKCCNFTERNPFTTNEYWSLSALASIAMMLAVIFIIKFY